MITAFCTWYIYTLSMYQTLFTESHTTCAATAYRPVTHGTTTVATAIKQLTAPSMHILCLHLCSTELNFPFNWNSGYYICNCHQMLWIIYH